MDRQTGISTAARGIWAQLMLAPTKQRRVPRQNKWLPRPLCRHMRHPSIFVLFACWDSFVNACSWAGRDMIAFRRSFMPSISVVLLLPACLSMQLCAVIILPHTIFFLHWWWLAGLNRLRFHGGWWRASLKREWGLRTLPSQSRSL